MADLLPVGSVELVGEGGDGVSELQGLRVPLGQGAPQTLELSRQGPQLALRLLQLGLGEREEEGGFWFWFPRFRE